MNQENNIMFELLYDRIRKLEEEVSQLRQKIENPLETETHSLYKKYITTGTRVSDGVMMLGGLAGYAKKDTTRYLFQGSFYTKGRLVLNVIQDYCKNHPDTTRTQLGTIFPYSLLGNKTLGVVKNKEEAQLNYDYARRYFIQPHEELKLVDGNMYVSSQWGINNIDKFIDRARMLGYEIEPIALKQ